MQFLDALEGYWLARRRDFSSGTISDYSLTFKRFALHVGTKPVAEIVPADIHAFLNFLQSEYGLSNKSLANVWIALSSFWSWAEIELGVKHPIRGIIKLPKHRRPPVQPYTKTEIMAMIAATKNSAVWKTRNGRRTSSKRPTAQRDIAILITLLDTGIRASELCDLKFQDYDKKTGSLQIEHGKGDKARTVYLGEAGKKHLWRYLVDRQNIKATDPLFITRNGTPLIRDELLNLITSVAKRAGVERANVHRFRHTFAINFLRNGGNILGLQRIMGHESTETLRIYVTLAQADLEAVQAIASPADNWGL